MSRLAGIPRPTTVTALLILHQHSLVFSNGVSGLGLEEEETYEFQVVECMLRLRWGRMLVMASERFGTEAMGVIRQLLLYGKLRMPEIQAQCGSSEEIKDTCAYLIRGGYIHPTTLNQHVLVADQKARRFAKAVREAGVSMPTQRFLDETEDTAGRIVLETLAEEREVKNVLTERKSDKKRKGKEKVEYTINPDVHLRVNYNKFNVLLRNELVIKAAEDRWNSGAGAVMKAILEATLAEQLDSSESRTFNFVGLNTIVTHIAREDHKKIVAGLAGSSIKDIPQAVRGYIQIMAQEDQVKTNSNFLESSNDNPPNYQVRFDAIFSKLKATMLSQLVTEKISDRAARVLAVVARAKKAGETMVRDCAMLPLRDARIALSQLQKLSIIETQEVPKTGAKARAGFAAAEYHLWQVDLAKAYGHQLAGVYKTLGNILQRKAAELESGSLVMERLARVEEANMTKQEMNVKDQEDLTDLEDAIDKLTLAETRTETVVMILRDLPGGDQWL